MASRRGNLLYYVDFHTHMPETSEPRKAPGATGPEQIPEKLKHPTVENLADPQQAQRRADEAREATAKALKDETTPESRTSSPEAVKNVTDAQKGVRASVNSVLDGTLEGAVKNAGERIIKGKKLTPEEYHNAVLLTGTTSEELRKNEKIGEHWGRVHIAPGGKPLPVIFLVCGDSENLAKPNPPGDPDNLIFGSQDLFGRLKARGGCHVVQLRQGNTPASLFGNNTLHPLVGREHALTLARDVLGGKGVFAGAKMKISDARLWSFSYGASLIQEIDGIATEMKVPIAASVSLDGIQFRSIPPKALVTAPAHSPRHFNAYQETDASLPWPMGGINGKQIQARPGLTLTQRRIDTKNLKGIVGKDGKTKNNNTHQLLTWAHLDQNKKLYDDMEEFLLPKPKKE